MITRDLTTIPPAGPPGYGRRAGERRRGAAALMAAASAGAALAGEPRAARERLEEELRTALQARAVILRDEPAPLLAPHTVCFDVPFGHGECRARLEIVFDGPRPLDDWSCQVIDAATRLAALLLELERATGRLLSAGVRRLDALCSLSDDHDAAIVSLRWRGELTRHIVQFDQEETIRWRDSSVHRFLRISP